MFRKLVIISLLFGCFYRLADYRAWLPLRNYTVRAESPALEQRLWDVLPPRCVKFWPWLYFDSDSIAKYLERDLPVVVSTNMTSIGRFVTVMRWRTPWIKVQWRGFVWCVSRDGYMWSLAELGKLEKQANINIAKTWDTGPVWILDTQNQSANANANADADENKDANAGEQVPSGVVKSEILPMNSIAKFLGEYEQCSWFKMIQSIKMGRRAGLELFTLALENGTKQRFEILIQPGKYVNQDLGAAIEQVLSDLVLEGGNHLIDATYEGKFVLQTLPDRPKEGMK